MRLNRKRLNEIANIVANSATDYVADKITDNIVGADESDKVSNVETQEQEEISNYKEIVVTPKMIRMFKRHAKGPENESFKDFLSRGLNGATIVGFKRMPTRTGLAGSYKVRYVPVEEDAESIIPNASSSSNNLTPSTTSVILNQTTNNNQDNNQDNDAMMTYILQQIKQNRDKQKQEDQSVFAYRQQQADKIVNDIEEYIKQNKNK